jgi:SAM-dependent methyltransferase
MNAHELDANPALTRRIVRDLNRNPTLPEIDDSSVDAVVCTVSVDYLTDPLSVAAELRRVLKPGGRVHFGFSDRYFPTKVISLWLKANDFGRLWIAAAYVILFVLRPLSCSTTCKLTDRCDSVVAVNASRGCTRLRVRRGWCRAVKMPFSSTIRWFDRTVVRAPRVAR